MGNEMIKMKPKILVTEDDKENQKYLNFILRRKYDLDFCESSKVFFELIAEKNYNIFIMDITLHGEEAGLTIIETLKNSDEYKDIPIIGLSAHVFSQDRKKALEAGVDVYLTKPIENKKLMDTIEKLISKK
jgi:CheY-like chemotaxis protein